MSAAPGAAAPRRLIVTADDFGLSLSVNQAIERAHREGVLTCASLMVGAPAAADAVERVRRLPRLRVGLHLVVVDGRPVLPPAELPHLVDARGELPGDLQAAGVRFFFSPAARRELRRELRAQLEAFRRTGLALDHVNAHHHMHVHPTVAAALVEAGRGFGLRAVRVPSEPRAVLARTGAAPRPTLETRLAAAWSAVLRRRLRRAGLRTNDHVFGLAWTGAVTEARVLALLPHLPAGVSELFLHPALEEAGAAGSRPAEELRALTSPEVARVLREQGIRPIAFSDLEARAG